MKTFRFCLSTPNGHTYVTVNANWHTDAEAIAYATWGRDKVYYVGEVY